MSRASITIVYNYKRYLSPSAKAQERDRPGTRGALNGVDNRALGNATTISGRFVEEEDDKKGQRTIRDGKGFAPVRRRGTRGEEKKDEKRR